MRCAVTEDLNRYMREQKVREKREELREKAISERVAYLLLEGLK